MYPICFCMFIFLSFLRRESSAKSNEINMVAEFLITVNDTWDSNGCIMTVKTPNLMPGNFSNPVTVGSCDQGPFRYDIRKGDERGKYAIDILFKSSVIEDASPPTCTIYWNGSYLVPTTEDYLAKQSLLPGCFTMDSREGYHMTYYWFYLLTWSFL